MPKRIKIDCRDYDWQQRLESHLKAEGEVDLVNFNLSLDGPLCDNILKRYKVDILQQADSAKIRQRG